MTPPEPGSAELLADGAWLRALARRLVADAAAAEDAVAQTLATAVERAPDGGPRRGWLAAVLQNALRQGHRGELRRRAREAAVAARRGDAPSAAEVAARIDLSERLLGAVRALEEPFRTAIVLRFLDGLAPREVARRTGWPVKTVHSRVERGLARLRARLDRETAGGREAWLSALAPVAWPSSAALPAGLGAIAMGTKGKLAAGAVALVLVGVAVVQLAPLGTLEGDGRPAPVEAARPDLMTPGPSREGPGAVAAEGEVRSAVEAAPATAEPAEAPAPAARTFVGRVIDVERRPVAGVPVQFRPTSHPGSPPRVDEVPAVSDAAGEFTMALPTERGELVASSPDWASVLRPGVHDEPPPTPPVVIVAPRRTYEGITVDDAGQPVAGALVAARPPGLDVITEHGGEFATLVPMERTESGPDGHFRLEAVGGLAGSLLTARSPAHRPCVMTLPETSADDLRAVLPRLATGERVLAGRVQDALGAPVAGAYVALQAGEDTVAEPVQSGADGAFALILRDGEVREGTLTAAARGRLPARRAVTDTDYEGGQAIVLVLDREALRIEGQVLDAQGRPLAGAQVWTFDGESFGIVPRRMGGLDVAITADLEEVLSGAVEDHRSGREVRADEEGRFVLKGLLERTYTVYAMHPETLAVARADHVAAGSRGLVLRPEGAEDAVPVAGRVTTLTGEPIEGALLRASRTVELPEGGRRPMTAPMDFHAETDAQGYFRFEALCVDGSDLLLNSAGNEVPVAQRRALAEEADLEDVRFLVAAACWLRVELTDPSRADSFEVEDVDGRRMPLVFKIGDVTLSSIAASMESGRSDVIKVDEHARTLVLFKGPDEIGRVPLELVPGEVTVIRP